MCYHQRRSRGSNVIRRTVEEPVGLPSAPGCDWVTQREDFLKGRGHTEHLNEDLGSIREPTTTHRQLVREQRGPYYNPKSFIYINNDLLILQNSKAICT